MAANQGNKVKKLYFDVSLAATNQTFMCTQFTQGTPGDRYGALLPVLEALTGSSPALAKQRSTTKAYFIPTNQYASFNLPYVNFIGPTSNGTGKGFLAYLPFMTAGSVVAAKAGHEAIYGTGGASRHFAVFLRSVTATFGEGQVITGVLCVERQHSIEV